MNTGDDAIEIALATAFGDDRSADPDGDLQRLEVELARRASADGLLDIAYRTIDSPHGSLLLASTDQGLLRVAFSVEDHDAVLDRLARLVSPRMLESPGRTDDAARQLDDYFDGRRRAFDISLDLRLVVGFRREVIARLPEIPYGSTASYGQIAVDVGNPKAVRAVGSACANNPLPLVVPCHRVVRSDGTIGAYLGGTEVKRALLAMEAR